MDKPTNSSNENVQTTIKKLEASNKKLQSSNDELQLTIEDLKRNNRSRDLLEGSPVCNKIIDLDSHLLYMSSAGIEQLKISDIESFYGKTYPSVLYPEPMRAPLVEHLNRAMAGDISSVECPILDSDGNEVWYHTTFLPARDAEGRIEYIIATSVNITEQKLAQDEARDRRNELAHAARLGLMGELASGISHELNQPLMAITGFADAAQSLMDNGAFTQEEIGSLLGKIGNQSYRAGQIIRKVRELTQKSESDRSTVEINQLIDEAIDLTHDDARMGNIRISFTPNQAVPSILCDQIQIQQVVLNLLKNAFDSLIEHGGDAPVVKVETALTDGNAVVVSVEDNGFGIPEENIDHIFEIFYTSKSQGMGMGLAISRSIIEAHSGRLWAENNNKGGATFRFTLPLTGSREEKKVE